MNVRLSNKMRRIIIFNLIITLIAIAIHGYFLYRIIDTNNQIVSVMQERQVIRETAIRVLEKDGANLFFGRGMSAIFGMFISLLTLLLLYVYSQTNGFFAGFFAAFCGIFTTFIGGLALFYVLFSGKSERRLEERPLTFKNKWQSFIHEKSIQS
ncbi:hypothetical protein EZV73_17895 [Acidaminobacter sp. JC074]|uniref:hypothetical protein n=1 Tax=Acidaminobacter sp. JC074 TaxID=2530199 RepID=UPI001F0D8BB1|nr:hypothetical protein [Acidaminobacter sp. JC074]MCH4889458.1 hypothetical protein [Acidaminobacter sp. JC074]